MTGVSFGLAVCNRFAPLSVEPTLDECADSIVSDCPEDFNCSVSHVPSANSLNLYTSSGSTSDDHPSPYMYMSPQCPRFHGFPEQSAVVSYLLIIILSFPLPVQGFI